MTSVVLVAVFGRVMAVVKVELNCVGIVVGAWAVGKHYRHDLADSALEYSSVATQDRVRWSRQIVPSFSPWEHYLSLQLVAQFEN